MKKYLLISFTFIAIVVLSSCNLLTNSFKYGDITKEFTTSLVEKNYAKCISLLKIDNNVNQDTVKATLAKFSDIVIRNFGNKLEYSFIKSEKNYSTIAENNTPPNTTLVYVQFSNKKQFGIIQALFDDKSGKILDIKTLNVKENIPNMLPFWLFGLLAICIPIFNIYMLVQVKRSDMRRKWQKYLFIVFLNVPAIGYNAVTGLFIKYLNFQIMLGFSFAISDYLDSFWIFGVPIGAIIVLIKLKSGKYTSVNNNIQATNEELTLETEQ
ncbi:hypothetical protein [Mucilaginibacter sp.]|jgi:hypothetical protein|uniref:hypothetical protein n=1 Tax=Mucilaginibacter sp. TaxID=1882438 RepID=UPI0035658B41